ncbi:hypothetical protein THAOC_12770, partial [Thalassiosira oceanica]
RGREREEIGATGLDKLRPSQLESAAGPEFATSKHKYYVIGRRATTATAVQSQRGGCPRGPIRPDDACQRDDRGSAVLRRRSLSAERRGRSRALACPDRGGAPAGGDDERDDGSAPGSGKLGPTDPRDGPGAIDKTGASSAAAVISPVNARSDSREHPAPEVLSPDEVRLRILGRGEKQQQVGGQPNTTEQQRRERPKSFRELIRERRERNEADSGPPTSETDASRNIETLEDLVASLSHCLTGGQASAAAEYTSWLGDSLGVETVEDLAERVESSPGLLVAGNGTVGMWRKKEFCDAVRDVAARMRRR